MRRFELFSKRDPSGGIGTGIVAIGVEFPIDEQRNAWVVLKWLGEYPGIAFWPSVDDLLEVHGHLGAAEVLWLDPDETDQSEESSAETAQCHHNNGAFMAGGGSYT
ncbi:hypothetical protein JOF29_005721 [Kribbella aluminosa]|uniref:DUF3303 domain-containing protein n=1 Tax=Kribbella aluminosa TaxID=416017 RepID=A0ABS4UST1_9ACTN|nr:hypothetical protein [Kribbella aluminosa]MBP2354611.1 hypothetical protein [Kribbella aluminosa]